MILVLQPLLNSMARIIMSLWVISGHMQCKKAVHLLMSALCQQRTSRDLFGHLVGNGVISSTVAIMRLRAGQRSKMTVYLSVSWLFMPTYLIEKESFVG